MVPAVTLLYSVLLLSLLWLAHGREISYQGAPLQWTSQFRPCDCLKAAGGPHVSCEQVLSFLEVLL